MTTYLIISSCTFACYLAYKAGHSRGKAIGQHYGFITGRNYEKQMQNISKRKKKEFEFKHYQTN